MYHQRTQVRRCKKLSEGYNDQLLQEMCASFADRRIQIHFCKGWYVCAATAIMYQAGKNMQNRLGQTRSMNSQGASLMSRTWTFLPNLLMRESWSLILEQSLPWTMRGILPYESSTSLISVYVTSFERLTSIKSLNIKTEDVNNIAFDLRACVLSNFLTALSWYDPGKASQD